MNPPFLTAPQLVQKGNIDYLVSDYLSEITMSLLAAAKRKNPVRIVSVVHCMFGGIF